MWECGHLPLKHIGFNREGVGTQLGTVGESAVLKGMGRAAACRGSPLERVPEEKEKRVWVEHWGTKILKGVKGTRSHGEAESLTRGRRRKCYLHPRWDFCKRKEGVDSWFMMDGYPTCPLQLTDHLATCCDSNS